MLNKSYLDQSGEKTARDLAQHTNVPDVTTGIRVVISASTLQAEHSTLIRVLILVNTGAFLRNTGN